MAKKPLTKRRRLTIKKQIQLRLRAYNIVQEALEIGLGFALNRLADAGVDVDDELRERVKEPMLNELMIALEDKIDWDKSG